MYRSCLLAVCLFAVAAQGSFVITPAKISQREIHPFGVVVGVEDCGSIGQLLEVRVTDCTLVPCQVTVGLTYAVEIDFVPLSSHSFLQLRVVITPENGEAVTLLDEPVPGSSVFGGLAYTFTLNQPITDQFLGPNDLQIELLGGGSVLEVCGSAALQVNA